MTSNKQNIDDSGDKALLTKNVQQPQPRDSFEKRFCDDLCEEILRWLPFDEKIKQICVSKQFNRCLKTVWTRQKVLKIGTYVENDRNNCLEFVTQFTEEATNRSTIKVLRLIKLLQTFPDITSIVIEACGDHYINISLTLDLITEYCTKLESFESHFSGFNSESIKNFALKLGPNLKKLDINGWNFSYQDLLKQSTSLTSLKIIGRSDVAFQFDDSSSSYEFLAKNLKKLSINFVHFNSFNSLKEVIKNNKNLTHLDIEFDDSINALEISQAFKLISELNNKLVCLRIELLDNDSYDPQMAKSFDLIANNCHNLKTLYFEVYNYSNERTDFPPIEDLFRGAFKKISSLNKLKLHLINDIFNCNEFNLSVDNCIDNCRQLSHLSITTYNIPKELFSNIGSIFPRLKILSMRIGDQLSDTELNSISRLKELRTLHISSELYELSSITDSGLLSLIDGCNHLTSLSIYYKISITGKSINSMIQKAIGKPSDYFKYTFYLNICDKSVSEIMSKCLKINNIEMKIRNKLF